MNVNKKELKLTVTVENGTRVLTKNKLTVKETLTILEYQKQIAKKTAQIGQFLDLYHTIENSVKNGAEDMTSDFINEENIEAVMKLNEIESEMVLLYYELMVKLFSDQINFEEEVLFEDTVEFEALIMCFKEWLEFTSNADETAKKKIQNKLKGIQ